VAKRIVFTGGSGKAGKHVVPWLKAKGYDILNLDLKPLDCPGVNTLITDVTHTTAARLAVAAPADADAARRSGALVAFSSAVREDADALKTFLFENLYRHYKVMRMTNKARRIVRELYSAFVHEPRLLPPDYRHDDDLRQARAIADYIAGMTDRYAIREHHRLFRMGDQFD
jgi:dGTPase